MHPQRGRRTVPAHRIVHHPANRDLLAGSRHAAKELVHSKQRGNGQGNSVSWNVLDGRKASIIHLLSPAHLIQRNHLHGGSIIQICRRIIESKMPIDPNAQQHQIDTRLRQQLRILIARISHITSRLNEVNASKWDTIKDRRAKPCTKTLRSIGLQPNVLIHMKRSDTRPVDPRLRH